MWHTFPGLEIWSWLHGLHNLSVVGQSDMTFFSFVEAAVASSTVFVVVTVVDIIKIIDNYG